MRSIIIPKQQAYKFRKIKLNWHTGIDAVELEDGTWFIAEEDYKKLPSELTKSVGEKSYNIKSELKKLPVRELKSTDFKKIDITINRGITK